MLDWFTSSLVPHTLFNHLAGISFLASFLCCCCRHWDQRPKGSAALQPFTVCWLLPGKSSLDFTLPLAAQPTHVSLGSADLHSHRSLALNIAKRISLAVVWTLDSPVCISSPFASLEQVLAASCPNPWHKNQYSIPMSNLGLRRELTCSLRTQRDHPVWLGRVEKRTMRRPGNSPCTYSTREH